MKKRLSVALVVYKPKLNYTSAESSCPNPGDRYKLPCNKDIDPWKETKEKITDLNKETEEEGEEPWDHVESANDAIAVIMEVQFL